MPPAIVPDLPLVELHRHLDGNVRLATVLDLARQHGVRLPADDLDSLRPYAQVSAPVPSLTHFLEKFELLKQIFVDPAAIERITYENLEDAAREKIDYVELRFSPAFMGQRYGLAPAEVTAAVCRALEHARGRVPVLANLIVIMSRHLGEERCWAELETALAHQRDGVVGVDLAGDEAGFPGARFTEHFARARAAGLRVTVHAGEAAGPESVYQAIEELGAERLGHAVRAAADERLLALIGERGIAIESCPTSNVQTSTVASYAAHPLPEFLRRGLLVSLGTDDPSISGISLVHEYRVARDHMRLSAAELRQLQENGLRAAFLSDQERKLLRARAARRTSYACED